MKTEKKEKKFSQVAVEVNAKQKLNIYAADKGIQIKDAIILAIESLCGEITVDNTKSKPKGK